MGDTTDNAIGNNIRAVRVDAGLTQTEFAKRLQVSQTTVSSWETGSSQPRRSNLFILLSEFPGLTLEDINSEKNGFARRSLRRSSDSQPEQAPLLGRVAAGAPRDAFPIEEYVAVPHSLHERYPNAFFLRVSGESMNRVLPNGCLALVVPESEVVNGHVYVFGTESGDFTVKRASVTEDRITLMPDSYLPGYEPIEFTRSGERPRPRVIGRVVWFTAGGRSRALFSQSQFKGREGKSPCRACQSSCKGAAGASSPPLRKRPHGIGCLEIVLVPFLSYLEIDSSRTKIADM